MEPKFQSSFIPKGPIAAASPMAAQYAKPRPTLYGFVSTLIFSIVLILCLGLFGYDRYLLSRIGTMGENLKTAQAALQPDTINSLVNADKRIIGTKLLISKHTALSPFFDYIEGATLKNVRFSEFIYSWDDKGITVVMKGQARSYGDVAQQSEAFNNSKIFQNPVFSDLDLDTKGNVTFTFQAKLDPSAVAYKKRFEGAPVSTIPAAPVTVALPAATSTAAAQQATTTKPAATSTKQ